MEGFDFLYACPANPPVATSEFPPGSPQFPPDVPGAPEVAVAVGPLQSVPNEVQKVPVGVSPACPASNARWNPCPFPPGPPTPPGLVILPESLRLCDT